MVTNPTIWLAAFVVYAAASLQWSAGDHSLSGLWLASLVAAYAIGATTKNVRPIWLVFLCLCTLNLIYCGWLWFGEDRYAYGLAGNQNYFGYALALGLAAAIAYDMLWFVPVAAVGLWFALSRWALVVAAVAAVVGLWRRYPMLSILLVAAYLLIAISYPREGSLFQRLGIWQDTLNQLTLWGHGYGSFLQNYAAWPVHRNLTGLVAPHAYNDYLELVFELGIGAVFAVFAVILALRYSGPDRLICAIFILSGLSYFPLYIPILGHLFVMSLGHHTRQRQDTSSLAFAFPRR